MTGNSIRVLTLALGLSSSPAYAAVDFHLPGTDTLLDVITQALKGEEVNVYIDGTDADWDPFAMDCLTIPRSTRVNIFSETSGSSVSIPGLMVRPGAAVSLTDVTIAGSCEAFDLPESSAGDGPVFGGLSLSGGLLVNQATVTLERVELYPSAHDWSLGVGMNGGTLSFNNSSIKDMVYGPGMFLFGKEHDLQATLEGATIERNAAGGIFFYGQTLEATETPTLTIKSSHFEENSDLSTRTGVLLSDGYGADVQAVSAGTVLVETTHFSGGMVGTGGGSLVMNASHLILRDSEVLSSNASYGGAIKIYGASDSLHASLDLSGTTFELNSASVQGGDIYAEYVDITISEVRASSSTAASGAFLFHKYGALDVIELDLQDWGAFDQGSALELVSLDSAALRRSMYCGGYGASAPLGSVISVDGGTDNPEVEITASVFQHNMVTGSPAKALVGSKGARLILTNNSFLSNDDPTAVYVLDGRLEAYNNLFYQQTTAVTLGSTVSTGSIGYNLYYKVETEFLADNPPTETGSLSDTDPLLWDGAYAAGSATCGNRPYLSFGSPAIDAGQPTVFDDDGSRSDIGAFGGPDGRLIDDDGDGSPIGQDCEDADPAISPEAQEIWYNEVDDDCNPLTVDDDADGDSVTVDLDCDDSNPLVTMGEAELANDGVDQDCNGYDQTYTYIGGRGCASATGSAQRLSLLLVLLTLCARRRR